MPTVDRVTACARQYWIAISLLNALFLGVVVTRLWHPHEAIPLYRRLSFPDWLFYPHALAQSLGIAVLWCSGSRRRRDFAFAGFLFDLLLALGAHLSRNEPPAVLPAVGLILWFNAWRADRQGFTYLVATEPSEVDPREACLERGPKNRSADEFEDSVE